MATERIIRESILGALGPIGYFYPVYVSRGLGAVFCVAGLIGIFRPVESSHVFGIPWGDERTAVFFPGIGGRNLAAGLMVLALNYMGDYKAVGVVLTCCIMNGIADTYICLTKGEKAIDHIVNVITLAILGPRLIAVG